MTEEFDPFKTCKGCPDRDYEHDCESKCEGKQYRKKKLQEKKEAMRAEKAKYKTIW